MKHVLARPLIFPYFLILILGYMNRHDSISKVFAMRFVEVDLILAYFNIQYVFCSECCISISHILEEK